jgi:single-stranded DNA-binding protein
MKLVTLLGTLSGTPAIQTSNGVTHAHFTLAVDDVDRLGEPVTELYEVVAFAKLAVSLAKAETGDELFVHGTFHQTTYTGLGGVQHHDLEIKAWKLQRTRPAARPRRVAAA